VSTVVVNKPDHIEFKNITSAQSPADSPTVSFQSGDWDAGNHTETGIVVDVFGAQLPLLSPADARKLAKWLTRAADEIDGCKSAKKRKPRYEPDDDSDIY
jgi:hypothetical protein